MLIALDAFPLTEPKAGIGHYTFELARELARLAPADDFELVAPDHAGFAAVTEDERGALPANLRLVGAPTRGLRLRWWSLGLPLYARERRLSLFHGTNYHVPLWQQCPTVLTVHDLSSLLHAEKHREGQVRRARARLPVMARAATRIIADSESVRREVCEHLRVAPEKVRAVPLAPRRAFTPVEGSEAGEVRHGLGVEENFLLFVGTVEPRKNLVTLARAYAALLRETNDAPQLVVAGQKGWLNEELFAVVEREGLGGRMKFTGYVSDETLRALYSSCRVCVYPSLYEGFGLPPLEAMACGAAVVASRIPPLEETLAGAALLFEPTDADALARALAELLADDSARARLAAAGRARAAEYTWERTARLTREVYEEAVGEWHAARGRSSAA
ncbi:MAG: glycosyltransferase family 4 protein [Acidobacteria bacterium]|nr:glycosyltransferase family 4 protein [Acidobacteriota bacterium]